MPAYRLGEVAEVLGVSVDTVRRLVDDGRLAATRTTGGQRRVDGAALAAYVREQETRGPASDLALHSTRNRLPGIVTRVVRDGVVAQVELRCGPHRIVALTTREAVDELHLEPGVLAVASVKATVVAVERLAPPPTEGHDDRAQEHG